MSTGVNSAIKKARDAGLYVIALDTPPDPANVVDITFATDNFKAGELIGAWAQVQQAGKPATIALLDLFNDKIVSVDYNRDQGFLTGMGIPVNDPKKNGDEAKTAMRAQADRIAAEFDLVRKDEFEALKAELSALRAEIEALKAAPKPAPAKKAAA